MDSYQQATTYAREASAAGYDVQVIQWCAAMDNYEPVPRTVAYGHAVHYSQTFNRKPEQQHTTAGIWMPCDNVAGIPLGNAIKSIALFDNGQSVQPYYCAGWNAYETDKQRDPSLHFGATGPYVLWHPFPLSQGTRPDNGRPVDMSHWMLGPRRAYHFKVTPLYLHSGGDWRNYEPGAYVNCYYHHNGPLPCPDQTDDSH